MVVKQSKPNRRKQEKRLEEIAIALPLFKKHEILRGYKIELEAILEEALNKEIKTMCRCLLKLYWRENQSWNILESNDIRDCVPTHYAYINPPKDTSADSPLSYNYDYGSPTTNVCCKECNGFIEVSHEDFNLFPLTVNDINHEPDCDFLSINEVNDE